MAIVFIRITFRQVSLRKLHPGGLFTVLVRILRRRTFRLIGINNFLPRALLRSGTRIFRTMFQRLNANIHGRHLQRNLTSRSCFRLFLVTNVNRHLTRCLHIQRARLVHSGHPRPIVRMANPSRIMTRRGTQRSNGRGSRPSVSHRSLLTLFIWGSLLQMFRRTSRRMNDRASGRHVSGVRVRDARRVVRIATHRSRSNHAGQQRRDHDSHRTKGRVPLTLNQTHRSPHRTTGRNSRSIVGNELHADRRLTLHLTSQKGRRGRHQDSSTRCHHHNGVARKALSRIRVKSSRSRTRPRSEPRRQKSRRHASGRHHQIHVRARQNSGNHGSRGPGIHPFGLCTFPSELSHFRFVLFFLASVRVASGRIPGLLIRRSFFRPVGVGIYVQASHGATFVVTGALSRPFWRVTWATRE